MIIPYLYFLYSSFNDVAEEDYCVIGESRYTTDHDEPLAPPANAYFQSNATRDFAYLYLNCTTGYQFDDNLTDHSFQCNLIFDEEYTNIAPGFLLPLESTNSTFRGCVGALISLS